MIPNWPLVHLSLPSCLLTSVPKHLPPGPDRPFGFPLPTIRLQLSCLHCLALVLCWEFLIVLSRDPQPVSLGMFSEPKEGGYW